MKTDRETLITKIIASHPAGTSFHGTKTPTHTYGRSPIYSISIVSTAKPSAIDSNEWLPLNYKGISFF